MAEPLLMIALSPTMEKGVIAGWQKGIGDTIETGEVICEVETDKATMDYEATQEGVLLEILLDQGESASVGEPIAIIGEEGEDVSQLKEELKKQLAGDTGSKSAEEQEPESKPETKEQTETESSQKKGKSKSKKKEERVKSEEGAESEAGGKSKERVKSSPLARRLAEQAGIDITKISGSGPGGRIVKQDIEEAKEGGNDSPGAPGTPSGTAGQNRTASSAAIQTERREKISGKREVIARRVSESMREAPHYYLDMEVKIAGLTTLREGINSSRLKEGKEKLGLNAFLMKLTAEALRRHPEILASWEGESIHYLPSADIGLAVAQEDGLITPVVRSCESKGIASIDQELNDLIPRAQKGKLKPEEYEGAAFSITNLGSYGISRFTAIINPPASAILAIGAVREVPVPDPQEGFRFEKQLTLTLGCDHRVIDGATGAAFMADLKSIIEEPGRALL